MSERVQVQRTPNPNAMKFTVAKRIVEGNASRSFHSATQASGDPIAEKLFEIAGVASVFMVDDFVTITRQADADWSAITAATIAVLETV